MYLCREKQNTNGLNNIMIIKKISAPLYFVSLLFMLFVAGCASNPTNMQKVQPGKVATTPEKGKAMVVFMRSSGFGGSILSNIFEIKNKKPILLGSVKAKEKITYQVEPGKHLFMVTGKNADFISAELKENKTYYVRVTPKMGRWIAHFSLYPMPINQIYSSHFKEQLESCEWVEKTPAAAHWANSNMASIQSQYREYYPKWIRKNLIERPELLARDGK